MAYDIRVLSYISHHHESPLTTPLPLPRHPRAMIPADLFYDSLNLALQGLGISCIVGGVGYITESQLTYRHIVEWVDRLCKGDGDTVLVTILFLSIASSWALPPMITD